MTLRREGIKVKLENCLDSLLFSFTGFVSYSTLKLLLGFPYYGSHLNIVLTQ